MNINRNTKTAILVMLIILLIVFCPNMENEACIFIGIASVVILAANYLFEKHYKGKGEIETFITNKLSSIEIGRGAAGVVYILPQLLPNYAFKISTDMGTCRKWQKEYQITLDIQKAVNIEVEYVRFAKIKSYKSNESECVMQMQRVIHPDDKNHMIHTMFSDLNKDFYTEKRGTSLGYNQLLKYLSPEKIKSIFKDLGRFMAYMHLVAKFDGKDIELLLGRTTTDPELRIYIVDFDQVNPVTDYSDESIDNISVCMGDIQYFPNTDVPDYQVFHDAYLSAGIEFGMEENAKKIITRYYDSYAAPLG